LRASRSGGLLGSPAYMAPEQTRGQEVDHRADVWSFSVVLYEMIAGKRPFTGDSPESVLRAIVSGEPAPLPAIPGDHGALSGILRRGLEKDLANRFSSMRELGEALAAWLIARGVTDDITGASIETPWGPRSSPTTDDELGSVRPSPLQSVGEPRGERATLHRRPSLAPSRRPSYLVMGTAVVAAVVGIVIGVSLGAKRRPVPKVAHGASPAASEPRAPVPSARPLGVSSGLPNSPIPVEPLDKIPVDGPGQGSPSSKGAGQRTKALLPFGHAPPRRTLKDPFR
jgi:serine/threonine protein kinase